MLTLLVCALPLFILWQHPLLFSVQKGEQEGPCSVPFSPPHATRSSVQMCVQGNITSIVTMIWSSLNIYFIWGSNGQKVIEQLNAPGVGLLHIPSTLIPMVAHLNQSISLCKYIYIISIYIYIFLACNFIYLSFVLHKKNFYSFIWRKKNFQIRIFMELIISFQ